MSMSVSPGSGTGFIISINVREAAFKIETTESKLQRVRRHQDGIPQSIVSDDSIPLPTHELSPRKCDYVFPLTDYCLCRNKHTHKDENISK